MRALSRLLLALILLLGAAALGASASAASTKTITGLDLSGVVDPFQASYISSGIDAAEEDGAAAVLITIDTPGGLDSSMRDIVGSILDSHVPVICYVAPEGARAASAGTFILLSCDVASMAPGTNVGAASPVGVSGAVEKTKVTNDATAFIRSIAEEKNRNAEWAESAVTDAESASAEEALKLGVIDSIEPSEAALLESLDGTTIEKQGAEVTLDLAGADVVDEKMGAVSSFLHSLITPNLAFLFFYLGIGLIIVEVLHPGISVPGILGALSLTAAFIAFGLLPVQLVGLILLVASVGLFVIEIKYPGISVAGIGAVITLVAGGLLLFDPAYPGVQVSPWVIVPVALGMTGFFAFAIPKVLAARKLPALHGLDRLVGQEGTVVRALNPEGTANVASELWTAESLGGTVRKGGRVRVVAHEGLRLMVEPVTDDEEPVTDDKPVEKVGGE